MCGGHTLEKTEIVHAVIMRGDDTCTTRNTIREQEEEKEEEKKQQQEAHCPNIE